MRPTFEETYGYYVNVWCLLGIHKYRWQFVGSSWDPDIYIKTCTRCGREKP